VPQILLPLSALRSTNGPSGRNPRLPFERHSAQARPPISLSKVALEEQRAKVLFHFSYNPSFPSLTLQDLAIPVPVPVPITKESSVPHFEPPIRRAPVLTQRVLRMKIACKI
jgi:hypothetical protein